jgi:uncharacterized protein (TIGR02145 family)
MKKYLFLVVFFLTQIIANAQGNKVVLSEVIDVEGNKYNPVKIGNQIWLDANLKTKQKRDGTPSNSIELGGEAGSLYDFNSACSVCPKGWHLPTKEE